MDSYDNEITSKKKLYDVILARGNNPKHFPAANNIKITKLADDYAEGELIITERALNPVGVVHGGCLATLADTVAGTAVATRGCASVTINYSMNFIVPARGTKITCVALPQKVGKTICVYDCVLTNDDGQKVATGTFTFFILSKDLTQRV